MLSRFFRKPPPERQRLEPSFDEGYRSREDGARLSADPAMRPHLSADPSAQDGSTLSSLIDGALAIRPASSTAFDDDLFPFESRSGGLSGTMGINPATGLPMMGAFDVAGNPFGFDNSCFGGMKIGSGDF